jgi:hypothetical protein
MAEGRHLALDQFRRLGLRVLGRQNGRNNSNRQCESDNSATLQMTEYGDRFTAEHERRDAPPAAH